jgi:hypothetical protein
VGALGGVAVVSGDAGTAGGGAVRDVSVALPPVAGVDGSVGAGAVTRPTASEQAEAATSDSAMRSRWPATAGRANGMMMDS